MPGRPNILFVCFDSLSALDGVPGGHSAATPALTGLIRKSICFSHTYTPCPESSPARASLFTGLDPCAHGLWTNGVTLPSDITTFPEILNRSGYLSWLFGRWQMAGVSNWTTEPVRKGTFSHIDWAHGPLHRSRQNAYLVWLKQRATDHYDQIFATQPDADDTNILPEQRKAMAELPDDLSFNHWIGESVCQQLRSLPAEQPYLAVASMVTGASMGSEPAPESDREVIDNRALQQADRALGTVLNELEQSGRAQDTIIIVTAARGTLNSAVQNTMCEQAIRVPLFIHHPDFGAQTIESPVSTIDIAPTVLDMAGLPASDSMQGNSLLDVINGSKPPRGWAMSRLRASVNQWKTALRSDQLKLVVSHGNPAKGIEAGHQLFDLEADPDEQQNLADHTLRSADLEAMIDQMIDARCALENRTEPRIAKF